MLVITANVALGGRGEQGWRAKGQERRWGEKERRGRTRRHLVVEVNSAFCYSVTGPLLSVCLCVEPREKQRVRVRDCLKQLHFDWCCIPPPVSLLLGRGTGVSAQIHSRKSLLDHRISQERQIVAMPSSFHTLPCMPADKLFPQKRSAGRRWSGTINFTLVLPASKACWSESRIWWHRDTPRRL